MGSMNELVSRVINGDKQAFEAIYQATYRQVYYTCMSFLKNEQNAQDIMQDTYITALTHMQQLENPERIIAWLNRIAINKCKAFLSKYMPEEFREEMVERDVLEENDNFLPESYVTNGEKRKIVLEIMQEELSAVQYQTIVLYYYDEMSVSEIAECMNCPEGTVTYRLSSARGKIKRAVQKYEDTSGIKLYSFGAVPLLTAIFTADAEKIVIPNVLSGIFSSFGSGVGVQTMEAVTNAATAAVNATAGTTATGTTAMAGTTAAATAVSTVAKATGKIGLRGIFQTVKAKIIAGVVATAVIAGGATGYVLYKNAEKESVKDKHYDEINQVVCDNDYLTVTIDRIYEPGYIPGTDEIELPVVAGEWNPQECLVQHTMVNHTDETVYLDMRFLTVNNESMDWDEFSTMTYIVEPHETQFSCINNHKNFFFRGTTMCLETGRNPINWAKVEYVVYTLDSGSGDMNVIEYDIKDMYFYGEKNKATDYERKIKDDREQVLVDTKMYKVTYVGSLLSYGEADKSFAGKPFFYIENKSDHDLRFLIEGEYVQDYDNDSVVLAGTNGYISDVWINPENHTDSSEESVLLHDMVINQVPFDVKVCVWDYTQACGGYVNPIQYENGILPNGMDGIELNNAMRESQTVYDAQFVNYDCTKE